MNKILFDKLQYIIKSLKYVVLADKDRTQGEWRYSYEEDEILAEIIQYPSVNPDPKVAYERIAWACKGVDASYISVASKMSGKSAKALILTIETLIKIVDYNALLINSSDYKTAVVSYSEANETLKEIAEYWSVDNKNNDDIIPL